MSNKNPLDYILKWFNKKKACMFFVFCKCEANIIIEKYDIRASFSNISIIRVYIYHSRVCCYLKGY